MLSERYIELLTAYVDGEISTRQRRMLMRALRRSAEARALLRKLQGDSREIGRLPRQRLDNTFAPQVMEAIAERGVQPARRPAVARQGRFAVWTGWAAAAAVLLAVGAASYFASPLLLKNDRPKNGSLAEREDDGIGPHKDPATNRKNPVLARRDAKTVSSAPREKPDSAPKIKKDNAPAENGSAVRVAENKAKPPTKSVDTEPDDKFLLGFPSDSSLPRIGDPNLSVMMPLQDLENKNNKDRLRAKLKKDDAFHVQMLCRDTAQGLERLRNVLASHSINLVIDAHALPRIKASKTKTTFVVYGEGLQSEELVAIFEELGRADKAAPEQFGYMVVNSMSPKFRQQVSKFLGVPPAPSPSGKSKAPLGVDVRKPLEDGTASDVERALKDRETARSQAKQPGKARRQVLVLAYNEDKSPVHPRAAHSREVKQFRTRRLERPGGTLQVVLVLLRDNV